MSTHGITRSHVMGKRLSRRSYHDGIPENSSVGLFRPKIISFNRPAQMCTTARIVSIVDMPLWPSEDAHEKLVPFRVIILSSRLADDFNREMFQQNRSYIVDSMKPIDFYIFLRNTCDFDLSVRGMLLPLKVTEEPEEPKGPSFTGGYVFEPVPGIHHNALTMDWGFY